MYHDASGNPYEIFIHHNAGLDGAGGSSYIYGVILRERDENLDDTLEERRYFCQNWRSDVVVVLTDAGVQVERITYDPYGQPFGMPAGDTNFDGDYDTGGGGTDGDKITNWTTSGHAYRAYADVNLDGSIGSADAAAATVTTLGRGVLSGSATRNTLGYAGYTRDSYVDDLYHVRHRVYKVSHGRWVQRPVSVLPGVLPSHLYSPPQFDISRECDEFFRRFYCISPCSQEKRDMICGLLGILRGRCPIVPLQSGCDTCLTPSPAPTPVFSIGGASSRKTSCVSGVGCSSRTIDDIIRPPTACETPIPPGGGVQCGGYGCTTHSIVLCTDSPFQTPSACGDPCDTLIHELVHAIDECADGSVDCSLRFCNESLCSEIHAYNVEGACDAFVNFPLLFEECLCQRACDSMDGSGCFGGGRAGCCSRCRRWVSLGYCLDRISSPSDPPIRVTD